MDRATLPHAQLTVASVYRTVGVASKPRSRSLWCNNTLLSDVTAGIIMAS